MSGLFFDNWDTPVFRPPSESGSFILRVTRGCAHNSCTYCNMYRGVRFEKLSDDEIMRQIAMAYSVDRDGVRRVFLADGDALKGLIDITHQAGAEVVGAGICIEKAFQPGGERIREMNIDLHSLVRIGLDSDGNMVILDD